MYGSVSDFRSTFLPVALSSVTDSVIEKALTRASSVADSYLRKRYTLPLVGSYDDLTENVYRLAAPIALRFKGFNPNADADANILADEERALSWFRDVAKGLVEPGFTDSTPELDEMGTLSSSGEDSDFTGFFRPPSY